MAPPLFLPPDASDLSRGTRAPVHAQVDRRSNPAWFELGVHVSAHVDRRFLSHLRRQTRSAQGVLVNTDAGRSLPTIRRFEMDTDPRIC